MKKIGISSGSLKKICAAQKARYAAIKAGKQPAEVVPVKVPAAAKPGGDLAEVSKKIGEEFKQFQMAHRDAAFRGIRIGLLSYCAKEQLPHGEFLPWLEKEHPEIAPRTAQKFMAETKAAMDQKSLQRLGPLLLGEGSKKAVANAEQALLKFIDGRTQQQLRADLHGGKKPEAPDEKAKRAHGAKVQTLIDLRLACENFKQFRSSMNDEQYNTGCARLIATIEEVTGSAWSPDPTAERAGHTEFKEHAHCYEA